MYTAREEELKQEIRRLARERNALLLAHNYQRDEIQEIADITGDSLGLSQEAARTACEVIVFCGVHFMAESAAILAPEKIVLLPRLDAGCPMADMVTPEGLRQMKAQHPGAPVVTYVNSSADVKAESDICCTSANAVRVVNSLDADEVILVPDRNLGRYIASHTDKTCHLWEGYCPTHDRLLVADVERVLAEHPDALFTHPVSAGNSALRTTSAPPAACTTTREEPGEKFIVGTGRGSSGGCAGDLTRFILPTSRLICERDSPP
jgi:quinolinate synthase